MYWKIKNISGNQIKFTIALGPATSPGIVLQPNQFVIGLPKMTTMLDIQEKRKFVEVERNFSNLRSLELGKVYDASSFDDTEEQINNYKQS